MSRSEPSYDLRALFKAIGQFRAYRGLDSSPTERERADAPVEMIESRPSKVEDVPLVVAGFLDGIQATLCVTHREQRPVYLYYVASAVLGDKAVVEGVREHLGLVCSDKDRVWAESISAGVPVETLSEDTPPELERAASRLISLARDGLERALIEDLLDQDCGRIVLDGSLMGRRDDERLVGVIKTTSRQWLEDESVLWGLKEGWRSPVFKIIGRGDTPNRYSCYVQMTDKSASAWNTGLIRLEAFDPELLGPLAARCLSERQGQLSKDPRWDRHLGSVRVVEEFLRARRPAVFSL